MKNVLIPLLIFLFGASIGSFLSVAIYRIQKKLPGILIGHSICPSCKKRLSSQEMIPIVSYLMLGGKCSKCKKAISPLYLYLEITTGLVFLALYLHYPFMETSELLLPLIFNTLYASFFIAILFYDLQTKKIPDLFLFPLLGISLVGSLVMGAPSIPSMFGAALIAFLFFGGQIAVSKGKWLGEGDLYLSISLAVIFGWKLFIVSIVLSYFIGAIISIGLLATKKVKPKSTIAFGPFLVLGAITTIFFGNDLLAWYLSSLVI